MSRLDLTSNIIQKCTITDRDSMHSEKTPLRDCYIIKNKIFKDERGFFYESFNAQTFVKETGLDIAFVQDNQSRSSRGVLRGLHFQKGDHSQAKLVRVLQGEVLDVVVDLRRSSPTFGNSFSIVLSETSNTQLFVPRGFAHGFVVLSDTADFFYKCDNYYNKSAESGIIFNDPTLNIDWKIPIEQLIVSDKDAVLPVFTKSQTIFE